MVLAADLNDQELHHPLHHHAMTSVLSQATDSPIVETERDPEKHYEFVNNRWEEKAMAGARHGGVNVRLLVKIAIYLEQQPIGALYGANTTFMIGNNQRLPDIAFIHNERIPKDGEPEGIWPIAPDLAIEVISPNDLYDQVMEKTLDYLNAGVTEVWLVSPALRTVTIYRDLKHPQVFLETETLEGSVVLPNFRLSLSTLFRNPTPSTE